MTPVAFMENMKFGKKLESILKARDIKPAELSRLTGIYAARLSEWTTGEKGKPSLKQAFLIARALDVPLEYLADDEQDQPLATGLTETQSRILWLAELVGYEKAAKKLTADDPDPSGMTFEHAAISKPPKSADVQTARKRRGKIG